MAITSEEAHASFRDFKKNENMTVNEGKSAILAETIGIDVDGFQFEVVSKLTPQQVRLAADIEDAKTYNDIVKVFSEFMANVSVHPSMKSSAFWIDYDNETGYLPDIVNYILDNAERQAPVIKKFR